MASPQQTEMPGGRFVRNARDGNGEFVTCDAVGIADRKAMADTRDILALSEAYLPAKGGHINWQHEVYRRLGRVCVLTAKMPGLPGCEQIDGVTVRRIRLSRWSILRPESLLLYGNLAAHCIQEVLRRRPAAVLAARVLPEGLVAAIIGRVLHLPSLIFAHGEEIAVYGLGPQIDASVIARMKCWSLWWAYRCASRVIANSTFTANLLARGGIGGAKVALVHPGTDTRKFAPGPVSDTKDSRHGVHPGPVLLTVGKLCDRKGQDVVLRAMPLVLREFPTTRYIVAGDGPKRGELEMLAREVGVSENVNFLGRVCDSELPALYQSADVFVMPNRTLEGQGEVEGFGIVFLEASSSGKPVIGGDTGGTGDAIEHGVTGFLVDGRSPGVVAQVILEVLRQPALASRLGEAGRRRVLESFTWDQSAAKVAVAIQEAAHRRALPRSRP